jgi:hypothetical protein
MSGRTSTALASFFGNCVRLRRVYVEVPSHERKYAQDYRSCLDVAADQAIAVSGGDILEIRELSVRQANPTSFV